MAKAKTKKSDPKRDKADKKKAAEDAKLKKLEAAGGAATDESATVNGQIAVNLELAKRWSNWEVENIEVENIVFGDRYRKNPGDLHSLAKSINEKGLLQPIGVEKVAKGEYKIVAGGRRVMAVRDILKLPTIRAVVFDPLSKDADERKVMFLQMELEENTCREQPALSETLERSSLLDRLLGKAIPIPKGKKKRDVVAAATGISHETRRQADVVFTAAAQKDATPEVKELAEKMEAGEIAPTTAFKKLVQEESAELDGAGLPIPKNMRKAFIMRVTIDALIKDLQSANRTVMDICAADGGERLASQASTGLLKARVKDGETRHYSTGIADLINALTEATPYAQCPPCAQEHGELGKHSRKCETCGGSGHISKAVWDNLVKAEDKSIPAIEKLGKKAAAA